MEKLNVKNGDIMTGEPDVCSPLPFLNICFSSLPCLLHSMKQTKNSASRNESYEPVSSLPAPNKMNNDGKIYPIFPNMSDFSEDMALPLNSNVRLLLSFFVAFSFTQTGHIFSLWSLKYESALSPRNLWNAVWVGSKYGTRFNCTAD